MDLRLYPMVSVLAVVIAVLLCLHHWYPEVLLYQTRYAGIDSLRTYHFVLQNEPRETANCCRYQAAMVQNDRAQGRLLLYLPKDSVALHPGDTLITRTRIRRGGQIGTFDYGLYLRRQGIIGTAYAGRYHVRPCARRTTSIPLQQRLYRRLEQSGLYGDELATTGALTLGYKEDLDPQLRRRFQATGAAHVLAVSGLHTGIIYAILIGLLTLGKRYQPLYEDRWGRVGLGAIVIAAMWTYAWVTGMTPSVVRCVVMITMVEVGKMLYRRSPLLNTIASAAVLILLIRPLDLWSMSFQLSFAATIAIVLMVPGTRNKLLSMVMVSIAAQLGTMPITMCTFGQISNYFLLTNLLVLPIASVLVPMGLISVLLGGSWLGMIAGKGTFVLAWCMNHAVEWVEHLPGSVTYIHCTPLKALILYTAILPFALFMYRSKKNK